jgi:16S rRNA (cytosine1402-N4)-methyltransferase
MTGYHVPVLLNEAVEGLNIKNGGVYADLTFGGGGHSREILRRLGKNGKLVAFDQDADVQKNLPDDGRVVFVQGNFRFFHNYLQFLGLDKVDGVLADLGVSWHQFDVAERGFSFRSDGPLDMRMNLSSGTAASDFLQKTDFAKLARVLREYGEIDNAGKLARRILDAREKIKSTSDLVAALPEQERNHKSLARIFQAIRMEINGEINALQMMLLQTAEALKPGGRLVVIAYHSLEDRLVKTYLRSGDFEGKQERDLYGNLPNVPFTQVNKKVIVPGEEEIEQNNRARSARMRIGQRNG